jgi:pentatricopeptide repeat protein
VDFFGRFLKKGQRADAFIFTPILEGLCSEYRISEAVAMLLDKVPRLGCAPNVISYNIVIDGLCKIGAISKAFDLLDIMLSEHVASDVCMYNSLMDGLCKEGETEKAQELFCFMVSQGLQPNVVTYNTLVDG